MILNYSIINDTLNGIAYPVALKNEIEVSSVTIAQEGITIDGDVLSIEFKANLSAQEQLDLTVVVNAHTGKRAIEDAQKFQLVDDDQNAIGSVDDNGTKRLAFDFGALTLKGDDGDQGLQGIQGLTGSQGAAGQVSIFGSEYTFIESIAQSQTTSQTPFNKVTLSLTSIPIGTYRLSWNYSFAHSSTSKDFRAEIIIDSSQVFYHSQEIKDGGTDQSLSVSGFKTGISLGGDHTILLNYWAEKHTAYIENAVLEIWRLT